MVAEHNDESAVKELIENLSNKNKNIQNDCFKVLYEIGERKLFLLTNYTNELFLQLESKNNRLQWTSRLNDIEKETKKRVEKVIKKIGKITYVAEC